MTTLSFTYQFSLLEQECSQQLPEYPFNKCVRETEIGI